MVYSICAVCNQKVDAGEDPDIGMHLVCESCHTDLVVAWLNPIELMSINYDDFDRFDGDLIVENFQKITNKKGEKNASWKTQEKHQKNNRYKKEF